MEGLRRFLSREIGIEFKVCLYFCMILFFYFMYQIIQGSFNASILIMMEMVFTAYFIGYIQVYLLKNFDEAEKLGREEIGKILLGSLTYAVISYALSWFDRNPTATILYFLYMMICYLTVFLAYKIKRDIDTVQLNRELEQFKSGKEKREE